MIMIMIIIILIHSNHQNEVHSKSMIFNQQNIYIIYFHHTSQQHPWIFQQNPAFFASSLARSRRWLCTNCRSRLANWLAQTRQTHLGLDERLYEPRPGT
jgi:hypothetical protein